MNKYFSPTGAAKELTKFAANHTGPSTHDLVNKLYYRENPKATKLLFVFDWYDEIIICIRIFLPKIKLNFRNYTLLKYLHI